MPHAPRHPGGLRRAGALLSILAASTIGTTGCGAFAQPAGDSHTDQQAQTLATAIEFPRQHDAAGFARAALSVWRGEPNKLAVLQMTDLHPSSSTDAAARLVIRIHVPAHQSYGYGDKDEPAFDACYRLEFMLPSSAQVGTPERVDCPSDAVPITPPAPHFDHLPPHAARRLAAVLRALPASPTQAQADAALAKAFPPPAYGDAIVTGRRVAMAVGVSDRGHRECQIALRTGRRVEQVYPDPVTLEPGEMGCTAEQAIDPVRTH